MLEKVQELANMQEDLLKDHDDKLDALIDYLVSIKHNLSFLRFEQEVIKDYNYGLNTLLDTLLRTEIRSDISISTSKIFVLWNIIEKLYKRYYSSVMDESEYIFWRN